MDGIEKTFRDQISGRSDPKQIQEAVDATFIARPPFVAAAEALPAGLQRFCGAVVVAAADILRQEVVKYHVQRARAAVLPNERKDRPDTVQKAINDFIAEAASLDELVRVVIIDRAVREVLNEEYHRHHGASIQLVDNNGNRETFEDSYDRVMQERQKYDDVDALSLLIQMEQEVQLKELIRFLAPIERVALALRFDRLGASTALRLNDGLEGNGQESVSFRQWMIEVLGLDKVEAARITSRYRRCAHEIRRNAFGDQARARPFVLLNEDIGRLLDRRGAAITQMIKRILVKLRKLMAYQKRVA